MQQRTQFETLGCKNHPTEVAGYHLLDQPWIKLCPQCALNIAVCGRKIGKQLSGYQLENKRLLTALTDEMRNTADTIEDKNKSITEQVQRLQIKSDEEIGNEIRKLNQFIIHLLKMRDQLWEMYEQKVSKPLNNEVQKQSKLILNGMELKRALQNIQSNFNDLVQEKQAKIPIKQQIQIWKKLNIQTKQILSSFTNVFENFEDMKMTFFDKIKSVQLYMLSFQYPKYEDKENAESVLTETPINQSIITAPKTCNTRITQLKLRSNSKKSHQKEIESIVHSRKRKSIQDISNFPSRIGNFQL